VFYFPQVTHQNPVCGAPLLHTCYTAHPHISSWFDRLNNIWCCQRLRKKKQNSQLRGSFSWSRDLNWARQLRPASSFVIKSDKCNTWSTQATPVSVHRSKMDHAPPNAKPNLQLNLKNLTTRTNKLCSSCIRFRHQGPEHMPQMHCSL